MLDLAPVLGDLDPYALAALRALLRAGAGHWEHRPISEDLGARCPRWVLDAVGHLKSVQRGTFARDAQLPAEWLAAHATAVRLDTPTTWETVQAHVLRAVDAMRHESAYDVGSVFYPRSIPDWFVSTPPRKPRWSCFLRCANSGMGAPDETAWGRATRMRDSMPPDVQAVVEAALAAPGVMVYSTTGWTLAAQLWSWWQGSGPLMRDQFGPQHDRPLHLRHTARYDRVAGTFRVLVATVHAWATSRGGWGGWFPAPGRDEWAPFLDWVAVEHGVWLRPWSAPAPMHHDVAPRAPWESVFSLDALGNTPTAP